MSETTTNCFRRATDEEKRAFPCSEEYDLLIGPDGFECLLTEPEDRTWFRDLNPVVQLLNEQIAAQPATVICGLNEYGDEAVYIEGQLVREDSTIYMGELIKAIERRLPAGQPIRISQMVVKNETWPKAAEDLELAAAGKSRHSNARNVKQRKQLVVA